MRDPARIKPTLEAIERFWQQNPDARLGQLLWLLNHGNDPFYLEDNVLVAEIQYRLGNAEPDFEALHESNKQKFVKASSDPFYASLKHLGADQEEQIKKNQGAINWIKENFGQCIDSSEDDAEASEASDE